MTHKRKILTVVLLAGTQLVAAAPPASANPSKAPPAVAPDAQQPRARLELRRDLYRTDAAQARQQLGRFRALCDSEGYPLVGNIANKGRRYDVRAFCSDVRSLAAQSET
jgi:hypothetical protein